MIQTYIFTADRVIPIIDSIDRPVVVNVVIFTDLNSDGTVNILDIGIVAMAFGTEEGDENYNVLADLDENEEVNILDLSIVAMDYGKTT